MDAHANQHAAQQPGRLHQQDPPDEPVRLFAPTKPGLNARLIALGVFVANASVLLTAWLLTPNSDTGLGTHQALGLPPCGLEKVTGIPCATCGMTTSFSLAAHGRFVESFTNQPAGALLALLSAMAAVVSGYALITGMNMAPIGRVCWRPRTLILGGVIVVVAWAYKIVIHTGMFGVGT